MDKEAALIKQIKELGDQTEHLANTIHKIETKQRWSIYAHPWRFFVFSFLNGLFIVLGSTFGVALVFYGLHLLGYLPIFGDFFEALSSVLSKFQ